MIIYNQFLNKSAEFYQNIITSDWMRVAAKSLRRHSETEKNEIPGGGGGDLE